MQFITLTCLMVLNGIKNILLYWWGEDVNSKQYFPLSFQTVSINFKFWILPNHECYMLHTNNFILFFWCNSCWDVKITRTTWNIVIPIFFIIIPVKSFQFLFKWYLEFVVVLFHLWHFKYLSRFKSLNSCQKISLPFQNFYWNELSAKSHWYYSGNFYFVYEYVCDFGCQLYFCKIYDAYCYTSSL